ncbi:MAG: hypothetical protein AAF806_08455, partial [Bacteroidota bacterium]
LFVTLKNEDGVESVLIIPTGGIDFKVNTHYHAVFSTISKDDFPISLRLFLAKKPNENEKIGSEDDLCIRRYITMQQQILRAPKEEYIDLRRIKVKEEMLEDIRHMIGTYWIWRYLEDKVTKVVQLKLIIRDDFSVELEHPLYQAGYRDQIGSISITRQFKHQIFITTNRKDSSQVLSSLMIEVLQDKSKTLLGGTFCNVGNGEILPSAGKMALLREDSDVPMTDLHPEIFLEKDLRNHLFKYDEYPELIKLRQKLEGLHVKR